MKKVFALILALILAFPPQITATQASQPREIARTITGDFRSPRVGNWDVEAWADLRGVGTLRLDVFTDGAFEGTWGSSYNTLLRSGRKFDTNSPSSRISQIGDISMRYNAPEFQSSHGATYLCVYGWTRNQLIEWYIIEDWLHWNPERANRGNAPEFYTHHGTVETDGGTYDIISARRVNQPSIDGGETTFLQIFNVRRDRRRSGTINISAHFNRWAEVIQNIPVGNTSVSFSLDANLYEVSLCLEGFGGANPSNGGGRVDTLCIKYGANALCTDGGCYNCDGSILPPEPPPKCTCPDDRPFATLYEAELNAQIAASLNAGTPLGGLQASGSPTFGYAEVGLQVSGRTDDWNAVDVLLQPLNLRPDGTYRLTAHGAGAANQLQLQLPLAGEGNTWFTDTVTGTNGVVALEFSGTPPTIGGGPGNEGFRVRIRTAGTDNFVVSSIKIEGVPECCGQCHEICACGGFSEVLAPIERVNVVQICCELCGAEAIFRVTRILDKDTGAVVRERRAAKFDTSGELVACTNSKKDEVLS